LFDKDVRFQNGFGAMQKIEVGCIIDLNDPSKVEAFTR